MRQVPTFRLDEKMMAVWRISASILVFILGSIAIGTSLLVHFLTNLSFLLPALAILGTFVLGIVLIYMVPRIRYLRWRYELYETEIDLYSGIIIRKHTTIPLIRVQYTDTRQGPIMRKFGLAEVSIYTAGGEKGIPGLKLEDADSLRDRIATLAAAAREEV